MYVFWIADSESEVRFWKYGRLNMAAFK